MTNQIFSFYFPSGCLTSFNLYSILYKPPNNTKPIVKIEFNNSSVTLPEPEIKHKLLEWSVDSIENFSKLRLSIFSLLLNNQRIPINFDDLTFVSFSKDELNPDLIGNIFVFQFHGGYFARKSDFSLKSISAPSNFKCSTNKKLKEYSAQCTALRKNMKLFDNANSPLSQNINQRNSYIQNTRNVRLQIYQDYQKVNCSAPQIHPEYLKQQKPKLVNQPSQPKPIQPRSKTISQLPKMQQGIINVSIVGSGASSTYEDEDSSQMSSSCISSDHDKGEEEEYDQDEAESTSAPSPPKPKIPNQHKEQDPSSCINFFPKERLGSLTPCNSEIKQVLIGLRDLFPLDVSKRTFCGICVDDTILISSKMLLFNILHFLTLFSEFTGVMYEYKITVGDSGWYNLIDRFNGQLVKRNINSRNMFNNPYRLAVINCLKKIIQDFKLEPASFDIIALLDAIFQIPSLL